MNRVLRQSGPKHGHERHPVHTRSPQGLIEKIMDNWIDEHQTSSSDPVIRSRLRPGAFRMLTLDPLEKLGSDPLRTLDQPETQVGFHPKPHLGSTGKTKVRSTAVVHDPSTSILDLHL